MNRIDRKFRELRERNEGALIGFVVAGDPTPRDTPGVVRALERGGADIIELGLPHTDPVADGPTIQIADLKALQAGTNTDTVIRMVREIRKTSEIPLVILTYFNPVLQYGIDRFCREFSKAGADGLIVADLPIDEAGEVLKACSRHALDPILLVAQTTPPERLRKIGKHSRGFLYVVSLLGVTGVRASLGKSTLSLIRRVKKYTDIPLAVGFGLSRPKHVKDVLKAGADGAIVGSAIVRLLREKDCLKKVESFASELKSATKPLRVKV